MHARAGTVEKAIEYDIEVKNDGLVELRVPFKSGVRVRVFVIEKRADEFDELRRASQTSTEFWDNPYDDEDWNNA